jgi:Family of unknown function (DUF6477)
MPAIPQPLSPLPAPAVMRRPKLLVSAARHGLCDYNRSRDLARILLLPRIPLRALESLRDCETEMEDRRLSGDPGYSCLRHVEVLIALMAELRLAAL